MQQFVIQLICNWSNAGINLEIWVTKSHGALWPGYGSCLGPHWGTGTMPLSGGWGGLGSAGWSHPAENELNTLLWSLTIVCPPSVMAFLGPIAVHRLQNILFWDLSKWRQWWIWNHRCWKSRFSGAGFSSSSISSSADFWYSSGPTAVVFVCQRHFWLLTKLN